jgi:hypothetical protein
MDGGGTHLASELGETFRGGVFGSQWLKQAQPTKVHGLGNFMATSTVS